MNCFIIIYPICAKTMLCNRVDFNNHLHRRHKENLNSSTYVDGIFYVLGCHATLTESHGEMTSFGFPTGYYNSMDCTWLIQGSHGEVIEITILHFDVEPDDIYQICK